MSAPTQEQCLEDLKAAIRDVITEIVTRPASDSDSEVAA